MTPFDTAKYHSETMLKLSLGERMAYLAKEFEDLAFSSDTDEADQIMVWAISTYAPSISVSPSLNVQRRPERKILFDLTRDRYDFEVKQPQDHKSFGAVLSSAYLNIKATDLVRWDAQRSRYILCPFADMGADDLLNLLFAHEIPVNFPLIGLISNSKLKDDAKQVVQSLVFQGDKHELNY